MKKSEHEKIREEVQNYKNNLGDGNSQYDEFLDRMQIAIGRNFNQETDPERRTRKDLVKLIATMEFIAGQYRDEIADGTYNHGEVPTDKLIMDIEKEIDDFQAETEEENQRIIKGLIEIISKLYKVDLK